MGGEETLGNGKIGAISLMITEVRITGQTISASSLGNIFTVLVRCSSFYAFLHFLCGFPPIHLLERCI